MPGGLLVQLGQLLELLVAARAAAHTRSSPLRRESEQSTSCHVMLPDAGATLRTALPAQSPITHLLPASMHRDGARLSS
jgi:hypothetical protein